MLRDRSVLITKPVQLKWVKPPIWCSGIMTPPSVYSRAHQVFIDGYLYYHRDDAARQPITDFALDQLVGVAMSKVKSALVLILAWASMAAAAADVAIQNVHIHIRQVLRSCQNQARSLFSRDVWWRLVLMWSFLPMSKSLMAPEKLLTRLVEPHSQIG